MKSLKTYEGDGTMSKLATAKQIEYAKKISKKLQVDLPKENTAYAYWKFIHDNEDKFMWNRYNGSAEGEFMEEYGNFGDYC